MYFLTLCSPVEYCTLINISMCVVQPMNMSGRDINANYESYMIFLLAMTTLRVVPYGDLDSSVRHVAFIPH